LLMSSTQGVPGAHFARQHRTVKVSQSAATPPTPKIAPSPCTPSRSHTTLAVFFSSTAPSFVMDIGSMGPVLCLYEDSNRSLSTDAGITWTMVLCEAHKYKFGDQGRIIVAANDEGSVDFVSYSTDLGKTWYVYSLPLTLPLTHATG
jgi:Sortilin, neurotensin receptor 3,